MAFTESDRITVLTALADEQKLKQAGRPYSEAVIQCCESALRVYPPAPADPDFHEQEVGAYWWTKDS